MKVKRRYDQMRISNALGTYFFGREGHDELDKESDLAVLIRSDFDSQRHLVRV